MITLTDLLPRIEKLASDAPEPKDVCWIAQGDEECDSEYCPDCAKKIVAWLKGKGEIPAFEEHEEHPEFDANMDLDKIYFEAEFYPDSDGGRHCDHCGHRLSYALTNYGITSEIEHFEAHPPNTPRDWLDFQEVAAAFEAVTGWCGDEVLKKRFLKLASNLKELE